MIEVLKQALDALKWASDQTNPEQNDHCLCPICKGIDALNQAIKELESQEPDVIMHWESHTWTTNNPPPKGSGDVGLYYTPPRRKKSSGKPSAWVGLTDEDRQAAFESMPDMLDGFLEKWGWLHFSKAIEAILKEKNT